MKKRTRILFVICFTGLFTATASFSQAIPQSVIEKNFRKPPAEAKPWVFWYWMQASVSSEGIRADIAAMKDAGIGGAYLMPIKDTTTPLLFDPPARQLTPEWWKMVTLAMQEAKNAGLKLGMHVSDGFALAGGPWITPAMSMQKLVWTKEYIKGGSTTPLTIDQPATKENYYKDIAVFAYPANSTNAFSEMVQVPSVTTSDGKRVSFLSFASDSKESYKSDTACWIQYEYPEQFTCRSITIHVGGNNYQAQRPTLQVSDDGDNFRTVVQLEPPRHGWQDTDEDVSHSIPATTARFFRFVYSKEGSEPGAEDLDAAKWKPSLKVMGIYLSDEPVIGQYESKNGSIWRVSKRITQLQVPDSLCIKLSEVINLTGRMDKKGKLNWNVPAGNWVIVRMGHTSTGHTNATGGAAKGLECDKFNADAVRLQFNNWFGKAFEKTDPALAAEVLRMFHVDSWECGSQNWSTNFPAEFKKRRGYDLLPYLLVMTGTPLNDIAGSEKILHDVRQTIAELVNDIFYVTLKKAARAKGCSFSAESVAPTMVSDGLLHYKNADLPMGEFWLNSPTHDKPNDMLDAISGAHVYGKNIIQAEAFTSIRMNWGEHPGNLKAVGDRNFALGINKMVLHVFTHNPWMDRKPGMTLDGIGVYFQRDQTWWKQGRAWIEYLQRCQSLLQTGRPVVDIAVFTGEEIPRRSVLPERLVQTLPGIFGQQKVMEENKRLKNEGTPLRQIPDGVTHSANMADPEDWVDPLNGYAYDSFNPDALLTRATVKNGRVVFADGTGYAILIFPFKQALQPDAGYMSVEVARKIEQLLLNGATILMDTRYMDVVGYGEKNEALRMIIQRLVRNDPHRKGRLIAIPYAGPSFKEIGLMKDLDIAAAKNSIAWTHRNSATEDIYFVANQKDSLQQTILSCRITGKEPEIWDPQTGEISKAKNWEIKDGRTIVSLELAPAAAAFVLFRNKTSTTRSMSAKAINKKIHPLTTPWKVQFDPQYGGPAAAMSFDSLKSWSSFTDAAIKYYSGTAIYTNQFVWDTITDAARTYIQLSEVNNIATIKVNGKEAGTVWTAPYRTEITGMLKKGNNLVEIAVTNTWANRLIGDNNLPQQQRITWTTAPFRLKDKPLLKAGLTGTVTIETAQ